jgi:hypothetical protein
MKFSVFFLLKIMESKWISILFVIKIQFNYTGYIIRTLNTEYITDYFIYIHIYVILFFENISFSYILIELNLKSKKIVKLN